jgi:hypothetical protein
LFRYGSAFFVADSAETTGLKWAAASSGSMTSLASGNLSTTTTISSISSAYKDLVLILRNPRPDTDGEGFNLRLNGNSGSVYKGDIAWAQTTGSFSSTAIQLCGGIDNATTSPSFIYVRIPDYANGKSTWKVVFIQGVTNNQTTATNWNVYNYSGISNITADINELVIYVQNGNINATPGTYELYGVK